MRKILAATAVVVMFLPASTSGAVIASQTDDSTPSIFTSTPEKVAYLGTSLTGQLRTVEISYTSTAFPVGGGYWGAWVQECDNSILTINCNYIISQDQRYLDPLITGNEYKFTGTAYASPGRKTFDMRNAFKFSSGATSTLPDGISLNSSKHYGFFLVVNSDIADRIYGDSSGNRYFVAEDDTVSGATYGRIVSPTTWYSGVVYVVNGNLTIAQGATLTIQPGAIVKFATATSTLTVEGSLVATGASSTQTVFTSINDDTVGGDTNGTSTSPGAGDWGGIIMATSSIANISDAEIRYGGAGGKGAINNLGGVLELQRTRLATSSSDGILTNGSTAITNIKQSRISGTTFGANIAKGNLYIATSTMVENVRGVNTSGGQTEVFDSTISGNSYGLYSDDAVLVVDSCNVSSNTTAGIYIENGAIGNNKISSSDIYSNANGVVVNTGTALIFSNSIQGNSVYGVLSNDSGNTTYATFNLWGDPSGPTGGGGTGDAVSTNVDYQHFATTTLNFVKVDLDGSTSTASAVDSDKKIYWDGTPYYENEFYSAIKIWNDIGGVDIATSTFGTTATMHLATVDSLSTVYDAYWQPDSQNLNVNIARMKSMDSAHKVNAIAHEIGHALGLAHSTSGNIMYPYTVGTISVGSQDILDYYFLHN